MKANAEDKKAIEDLQLLTDKPVIYVANVDEGSIHTGNSYVDALKNLVKDEGAEVVMVSAAIEAQLQSWTIRATARHSWRSTGSMNLA